MSTQKSKVRRCLVLCAMLASLLCAGYSVAQDKDQPRVGSIFDDQADEFEEPTYTPPADIEAKIKSIPPIPGNIKKHLKDKYVQIDDNRLSSTLMQTPYGPSGSIHIGGDITPKSGWDDITKGSTKEERARGMARTFIGEELSLFGITDMEELKERTFEITDDTGYTHIYYQRYIGNLPLDLSDIAVHIGSDEKIKVIQGNAIASPPALYKAVAKKTLGRGKIFRIIRDSLKSSPGSEVRLSIQNVRKVAVPNTPYVIWKIEAGGNEYSDGKVMDRGYWEYTIDAFTGEILQKIDARIPFKPVR